MYQEQLWDWNIFTDCKTSRAIYIYTHIPIQNSIILKLCSEYFLFPYTLICPTSKEGNICIYI